MQITILHIRITIRLAKKTHFSPFCSPLIFPARPLQLPLFSASVLMKKGPLPLKSESKSKKQMFTKEKLEKLLQHYFGYSGFRGKQLEAIEAVLSGTDCFCLMPTGGGKSMCYQIPALAKPGIVLVISPLIALMENQVATLKKKGIPADFLSSTQDAQTKKKIHEDLDSGKPSVKLLYATPELLATVQFMTKLKKLYNRGLLSLIAIDEAHCISTWGHDFRPSYRKLSSLRSHLQDVPILALTATAVPKVEKDVIESLNLQRPTILRASFNRANIFYEVRYKDLLDNVYNDIANLLKSSGNVCSIIYCLERSTCDDLSDHLSKNGISSAAYHAGLNNKMRSIVLDAWLSSRIQVVVATVAFGMGIDRQDVRIVCHYNIPKSMEAFYQESGRAGRDQLPARSVLYYGLQDRSRMEFILCNADSKKSKSSCSSGSTSKKALTDFNQMTEYCLGSGCRRKKILDCFGEQVTASFCQKSCDACKHPNLVSTRLGELKCVPQFNKKDGVAPIFMKSSLAAPFGGIDCEFWNRDDEADFSDGDISASDDEEDGLSSLARSTMASKSRLGEKFKALEHAEEIYFQNKVLKKGGGLSDKKVISETVREASKKRLLNALNQAQVRLGNQLSAVEDSAAFLEMECFTKYEKVGKTFYNSQIAATIRWLSSSDYEQISGRFRTSSFVATSQSRQDYLSNEAPSSLPGSANSVEMQFETSNKEAHNVIPPDLPSNSLQTSPAIANSNNRQDHLPNAASSSLQRMQLETNNKEARDFFLQDSPCNSLRNKEACDVILLDSPCKSVQEGDKIELPPIPSFSVFANKKGKERQKDYAKVKSQNHSRGFQKRPEEFEPHERKSPKKFRPR